MFQLVLNRGLLIYLQSNLLKGHLLERITNLKKYLKNLGLITKIYGIRYLPMVDLFKHSMHSTDGIMTKEEDLIKKTENPSKTCLKHLKK